MIIVSFSFFPLFFFSANSSFLSFSFLICLHPMLWQPPPSLTPCPDSSAQPLPVLVCQLRSSFKRTGSVFPRAGLTYAVSSPLSMLASSMPAILVATRHEANIAMAMLGSIKARESQEKLFSFSFFFFFSLSSVHSL